MNSHPKIITNSLHPISGLLKLGDLINFDGPVLSIFKDDIGQHFIFYWVDDDELSNRWLVWKSKDETLYNYINGSISLRDFILSDEKDYLFVIDIDDDLVYRNIIPVEPRMIPEPYLPKPKSYYKLPVPQFAIEILDAFVRSENYYRILMKDKSLVFNISPNVTNFSRAVTTQDAGSFLSRLSRSMNGFIEEKFWLTFKDVIPSSTEFNRLLNQAKEILTPRLFGLRYGSFEVSVGVDTVKKIDLVDFSDWQHQLLPDYERDVVNIDYNDWEQLTFIAKNYSEAAREKIYDPYIKIINSTHYDFVIKDKANKIIRSYKKVDREKEEIVIPKRRPAEAQLPKRKTFVSLIVEVTEGQTVEELNKKLLQSGLLFSQQLNELDLTLESATDGNTTIYFKTSLPYTFSVVNNVYSAYVNDLGIYLENADKVALVQNLQSELVRLYRSSFDQPDSDVTKLFFEKIIERVDEIIQ